MPWPLSASLSCHDANAQGVIHEPSSGIVSPWVTDKTATAQFLLGLP